MKPRNKNLLSCEITHIPHSNHYNGTDSGVQRRTNKNSDKQALSNLSIGIVYSHIQKAITPPAINKYFL